MKTQYEEAANNIRKTRAAGGIVDNPQALEEILRQMGLVSLRERVEKLAFRVKLFSQAVDEQKADSKVSEIDPDRTLLFTDPPKTFETKFALQVYLSEPGNEAVKERYERWREAYGKV
jgi:hypothetical protein